MPTNYTQINDYSDELGTTHGLHLDQDFTAVASSIATVTESLALVQRGDGRLQDVCVEVHTISPEVLNLMGGFNMRGLWAPATAYAVNDLASEGSYTYVCKTAHTSGGAFSSTNWIQFGFTTGADAAAAAAAAQVSQASALASATTATTQAGIATAAASTATTQASTSTTNATNASNSAIASAASASAANGSAVAASASAVSATASAAAAAAVVAPAIHGATTKATPVDADELPMSDSAASWVIKKFTWANLKSVLKTYFDTLYLPLLPAGTIIDFSGTSAPAGYLVCPTSLTNINRTTYATLFAAIGTTWGVGDGSTTFGLPWFAANYASVQANANVGTTTTGQILDHTHLSFNTSGGTGATGVTFGQPGQSSGVSGAASGGANLAAGVRVLKCIKY